MDQYHKNLLLGQNFILISLFKESVSLDYIWLSMVSTDRDYRLNMTRDFFM